MTFRELGLCAPILKALEEQGYQVPSPIQQYAIPLALKGNDVATGLYNEVMELPERKD